MGSSFGDMIGILAVFCSLLWVSNAALLSTLELLAEYGVEGEEHQVTTKDGYILTIFRAPSPGKTPVVLMPGFLSSSNTWVAIPRNQSLVAQLIDQGYDVWILNYRGSAYGKNHVSLDPKNDAAQFWNFSFHEIGSLDLPAILDYVLSETGFSDLLYIGHSMGTLSLYVMCVERPDYCQKVRAAGLLAPVIFPPSAVDRALIALGVRLVRAFASTARRMGIHEALTNEKDIARALDITCRMPVFGKALCSLSVNLPFKRTTDKVDRRTLPKYIVNSLSGTSVKCTDHLAQLMSSRKQVPMYDYGHDQNKKKYKNGYSPYYSGKISTPLIIFHSSTDPFTDSKAVRDLKKVANVVYDKVIKDESFNHVNFLFSNDANKYVNNDLITLFNKISDL